uniref:Adaptin_N domain-containing protein n=1 Tax=Heterorhabditis bacteriophora TaxID=37862 RepID=A0A1I7X886_HETBA
MPYRAELKRPDLKVCSLITYVVTTKVILYSENAECVAELLDDLVKAALYDHMRVITARLFSCVVSLVSHNARAFLFHKTGYRDDSASRRVRAPGNNIPGDT